ncbi:MAG: hypothetical protein L6R38_001195 [Xanthoria sp. 2 TBL-2021]|nr:MAG: hypothetical protein L6R38_001195 [Xanthoria sp. 2 TBL-2021]
MASFHLSNRTPILSSAWAGPSLRMDEDEYRSYKLIKATVKRQEEEKKQAENKRRVIEGLPPLKDSVATKAKRSLLKVMSL